MSERIKIVRGDITTQCVDAIVNAANNSLLSGGGVDGAIHAKAGPELLKECKVLGGCATGNAKITKGYDLAARFVIHTVGPVFRDGDSGEDKLLASCYRRCLEVAKTHAIKTIAFPSISTGAYRFPVERASHVALRQIQQFLESDETLEKVIIVCFNQDAHDAYAHALESMS